MSEVFGNATGAIDLRNSLEIAFDDLDKILKDHSGPFASNAVIGSKWRQHNDVDEFTKDGISILRHLIVSEDPVARFAARMARFIGITVDSRCHDGTTTSMLLFCRLAYLAVAKIGAEFLSNERYKYQWELHKLLSLCLAHLELIKITEDDIFHRCISNDGLGDTTIEDVRAAMAYHMAMISSKGDHDLSTKISTVIKQSPKKIYGMFKSSNLAVETDETYILKKQEYDLAVNGNLANLNDYNYKNDTQYMTEHAVIFCSNNDIVINSWESLFLQAFISTDVRHRANLTEFGTELGWESFHEGRRNLIIMAPMIDDYTLVAAINAFNRENPNIKISWFNLQLNPRMKTSFNKTLHYIAGVPLFADVQSTDATKSLVGLGGQDVKLHLLGYTIQIYNLYPKDGNIYHPFYQDPAAFDVYTEFAKETEELIEFANRNITNPILDHDEVTYLISLYRALTCQEIWDIDVGGSIHDQRANRTVFEDAMGAALSAVNEGVILGGYGQLALFLNQLTIKNRLGEKIPLIEEFRDKLIHVVSDSLRVDDSNKDLLDLLFSDLENDDHTDTKWKYIAADTKIVHDNDPSKSHIDRYTLDGGMLKDFLQMSPDKPILLQAFGGYHEQFKRFIDIIPRLANTTALVDMRTQDGSVD